MKQIVRPERKMTASAFLRQTFSSVHVPAWTAIIITITLCSFCSGTPVHASKDRETTSPGLVTELSASLDDVMQALQEVLHDQIIHGTYVYEKQQTLTGAAAVDSTPLFEPWHEDGKVFYKVRTAAIAPRHFRDSADRGTIAVRYIVTSVSADHTRLRIDAVFVEDSRHGAHPSDGSVESAETKVIQERVQSIQAARAQAAEEQRRRDELDLANRNLLRQREEESMRLATAESSAQDLEKRVNELRHQLEMRIKAPGASLKTAPYHSAADVATLSAYTGVLIVIVTPRWYGVESPDGRRGWVSQDQVERLP